MGATRGWSALILVAIFGGTAAADLAAPPPLPAPPEIDGKTAASFNLSSRMKLWFDIFNGRSCILKETNPAAQIQGIGTMISQHRGTPQENAALAAYFNDHLMVHGKAWLAGVPGFGTWTELADRKNASFDWLEANQPKGPVDTAEQAKVYVAAYHAFTARAADDHKYSNALKAASPCHRQDKAPTGSPQGARHFTIWSHLTSPVQIEQTLAPTREKLVPQTIPGEADAVRVLGEAKTAKLDRLFAYGKLLKDAYAAYGSLEQGKVAAERMTWFSTLYDGPRAKEMADAPRRVTEHQAALAALIVKLIPDVKPAKAVGGVPAATVKKVLTGKQILASRATSAVRTGDKVTTDEKALTETTVLVRTYNVAFTAFDVQWVTAAKETWLDIPGLPVKDVCALHHAVVRKYTKGVDVQLNKWLVMQSDVLSPMLCKEKASTSSLAE